MKKINKKNYNLLYVVGLIVVFISILSVSIGYSALNINLTISGDASVTLEKDINITNVVASSMVGGAFETSNSVHTGNSSNIFVTLPNIDSEATFKIEVTNNSDFYLHLTTYTVLGVTNNGSIGYEIIDKEAQYFLENSITEFEIRFFHIGDTVTNTEFNLNLEYEFDFVEYRKLDYITGTGTQWIDTGLMNTGDYIFETEVRQHSFTKGDGGWIISGRTTASYTLGVFFGTNGLFNGYGGTTTGLAPKPVFNVWYDIYFSRFNLYLNNVSYNVMGKQIIPEAYATTIRLGGATAGWTGGQDLRHFAGDIKFLKVTNADDGAKLRYFIPVRLNDTGEIGYWEEISGVFYANDGTGEFLGS